MIVFLIVNKKGHAESPEELISYYCEQPLYYHNYQSTTQQSTCQPTTQPSPS